jgi:arylsulfatase
MKQASPKDSSKVGPKTPAAQSKKPNVVYFLVDNLGMTELSSYIGGPLRGASTTRIDAFAQQGMMLLNSAPEA